MNSLDYMDNVKKYITEQGTTFKNHYCTTALCCPSRATIWTGRVAHNTNVTDVKPPYGGYAKVVSEGVNDDYLPIWMQNAGYNTYYVGKLWNAYGFKRYNHPPAKGFTHSDILLDPTTYRYYGSFMSHDGEEPTSYEGQYSPDVVAYKASQYLDEALASDKPWMLVAAPIAPHVQVVPAKPGKWKKHAMAPPAAPRHKDKLLGYKIPRTSNFNPDEVNYGASWVKHLPQLRDEIVEYNDDFQRRRIEALLSVDDMVEDLVTKLDEAGELDNTYIVYTADNGYHIGQHRMHPGKQCAYETDINVPFIVRGPNVEKGTTSDIISSHTDIAPTFMWIAGQDLRDDFDGHVMALTQEQILAGDNRHEHTQAEFWGGSNTEGRYGYELPRVLKSRKNNTYKAIRLVGKDYSLYYAVWCTNERELYDMKVRQSQVRAACVSD
jgi:N-acetylglucosamine-6-sulfatase